MSLWYPTRQFPPLPHAETHLKGGSDEVLNLTNINNAIGFSIESHADRHGYGGADPVSLDASQIVSGTLDLDRIPDTLTGKDADLWDGKHRDDDQTIGGNVTIGGDLQVNGNDIKDSDGTSRITLGSTITLNGDIKVVGNDILDSGGSTRITLGETIILNGDIRVNGNDILDSSGNVRITLGDPIELRAPTNGVRVAGPICDSNGLPKLDLYYSRTANSKQFSVFNSDNVEKMYLDYEGDLYAASFQTICLLEEKSAISDISDSDFLYVLERTPIHWYTLKSDPTRIRAGFIAEMVPFGFQAYENGQLVGVDLVAILATCVGAIKQLHRRVKELERLVEGLRARIAS